jgi:hypothetical protein
LFLLLPLGSYDSECDIIISLIFNNFKDHFVLLLLRQGIGTAYTGADKLGTLINGTFKVLLDAFNS